MDFFAHVVYISWAFTAGIGIWVINWSVNLGIDSSRTHGQRQQRGHLVLTSGHIGSHGIAAAENK